MMIFFFFFFPMILAVCLFSPLSSDQEQSTLSLCLGCLMEERVCLLQERKRRLSRMNPNLLMSLFLVKADNKLLSALISRPAEQTFSDVEVSLRLVPKLWFICYHRELKSLSLWDWNSAQMITIHWNYLEMLGSHFLTSLLLVGV